MTAFPLTRFLAAAGALPFLGCAIAPFVGIDSLPGLGQTYDIAAAYGLSIASFMAGVHWGIQLIAGRPLPTSLYLTSNAVAVAAWLTFLLGPPAVTLVVQAALFLYLLFIDFRLRAAGVIDTGYWQTRLWITTLVVVSLGATLAGLDL